MVLLRLFLLLLQVRQLQQLVQQQLKDLPSSMMLSAVYTVGSGFCGVA
jgi:hypothetical protein